MVVALGAGSIVLDVFTLGGSSLVKGGIKTGIKVGARSVASSVAKGGVQYTKSSLKLGQQMHKAYHAGEIGKEFRLLSGKRIDFLDIKNSTIYELKPFNPRAMQQGQRQLDMYLKELQSPAMLQKYPEFRGIQWKTVLNTY